jgi:hypothetical protein
VDQYSAAFDESFGTMYENIERHSSAILQSDPVAGVTDRVRRLVGLMRAVRKDARDVVSEVENLATTGEQIGFVLKLFGVGMASMSREKEINTLITELERYRRPQAS